MSCPEKLLPLGLLDGRPPLDFLIHAQCKAFGAMGVKYGKCFHPSQKVYTSLILRGPIKSLRVTGMQYVVLNILNATDDLLEK